MGVPGPVADGLARAVRQGFLKPAPGLRVAAVTRGGPAIRRACGLLPGCRAELNLMKPPPPSCHDN